MALEIKISRRQRERKKRALLMQADKNMAGKSFKLTEGSKLILTLTSSVGTGTSLRFEILFMVTSGRLKGPEM